jgi:hypothetical protein
MRKLGNCLRYDIKEGIFGMWQLYALALLLILMVAGEVSFFTEDAGVIQISEKMFEGINEYVYIKGGPPFEIPVRYLILSLLPGIFVCYYPIREWKLRGNMYISRYQSKGIWWLSKCIWCVFQSVLFYLTVFAAALIVSIVKGNAGGTQPDNAWTLFCYIYVLGFLTTLAFNQCILVFQMVLSPMIAYLIVMAVIVCSAYYFKWYLIGNYYMLLRSRIFLENGILFSRAAVFDVVLWGVAVIGGYVVVKRMDLI